MSEIKIQGSGSVDENLNQNPPVQYTRWGLPDAEQMEPVIFNQRGSVTRCNYLTPYGRRFLGRLGVRRSQPSFLFPEQASTRYRVHSMEEVNTANRNSERKNFPATRARRAPGPTSAPSAEAISKSDPSLFRDYVGIQRNSRDFQWGSGTPLSSGSRGARHENSYLTGESSPGCAELFSKQGDYGSRETRGADDSTRNTTRGSTHHGHGMGIGTSYPYSTSSVMDHEPGTRDLLVKPDPAAGAFYLDFSTVQKIVTEILPPTAGIAFGKDARDLLIECCVEFITLISSEANEISEKEAKKTIACEHITKALEHLGFGEYVADILTVASEHKEQLKGREKRTNKLESSNLSTEEMLALQEAEFRKAAERHR